MQNNMSTGGPGTSVAFLLFLVFLVLKLTKVIAWSWWWVTCPLWIFFAVVAAVVLVLLWLRLFAWSVLAGALTTGALGGILLWILL